MTAAKRLLSLGKVVKTSPLERGAELRHSALNVHPAVSRTFVALQRFVAAKHFKGVP